MNREVRARMTDDMRSWCLARGPQRCAHSELLFEEWCGEHKYLHRPGGCESDMLAMRGLGEASLALAHIVDAPSHATGALSPSATLKLAAFLWAAPRFLCNMPHWAG